MTYLSRYISCFIKNLGNFLHETCMPNPKYAKNQIEQQMNHNRIKTIFMCHLILFSFSAIQIFLKVDKFLMNLIPALANLVFILILLTLKAFHPEVIRIVYNVLVSIVVLMMKNNGELGIHRVWIMAPLYPTFIFWFTGSLRHFLLQAAIQFIYLNNIYQPVMRTSINVLQPEALLQSLLSNSNRMLVFNIIVIYSIQDHLRKAHITVYKAEKAKVEFEGQKTFLLGFSHELRNLLNSLMGNVKLASLEQLNDKSKEFLQNANLCGELLLHLVNNILDTGKSEIGDLEVNPIATSIHEPLEKIWRICSEIIKRKGLNGTLRIKKNVPMTMKIDHYRLTQVVLNLVGNAVKFTDSGSIDITIEWMNKYRDVNEGCFEPFPFNGQNEFSEGIIEKQRCFSILDTDYLCFDLSKRRINLSSLSQNVSSRHGVLKIIVSDTGSGMSPQGLDRLFQKFAQVNTDSSKRKLGTGLGLFITRQICEKMDGQIRAFSRENYGSCFIVCIPVETVVVKSPLHIQERALTSETQSFQDLKAMVIDDEQFSSMILKTYLVKLGINVIDIAKNGFEGFKKYSEYAKGNNEPQIITMDLEMPVMDGKKAAELIRDFESKLKMKPCLLIIISGNCSESEISECMDPDGKIRADVFLKKPANIEDLLHVILEKFGRRF